MVMTKVLLQRFCAAWTCNSCTVRAEALRCRMSEIWGEDLWKIPVVSVTLSLYPGGPVFERWSRSWDLSFQPRNIRGCGMFSPSFSGFKSKCSNNGPKNMRSFSGRWFLFKETYGCCDCLAAGVELSVSASDGTSNAKNATRTLEASVAERRREKTTEIYNHVCICTHTHVYIYIYIQPFLQNRIGDSSLQQPPKNLTPAAHKCIATAGDWLLNAGMAWPGSPVGCSWVLGSDCE